MTSTATNKLHRPNNAKCVSVRLLVKYGGIYTELFAEINVFSVSAK